MKVALLLCPCWTNYTPPLGLAYLSAVLKTAGHQVKCFDLNIGCYTSRKSEVDDLWDFGQHYRWTAPHFEKTFPLIKPALDRLIDDVAAFEPGMIGCSVYYTNVLSTLYVVRECRKRLRRPLSIVFGGPECYREWFVPNLVRHEDVDAIVSGEGEEAIVEIADVLSAGKPLSVVPGVLTREQMGERRSRHEVSDLSSLPFPDFNDFHLAEYKKDALPVMTSRGCVGRCSFCGEILYWKNFRYRPAEHIYSELENAAKSYGVREMFFNDSLVNGSIPELRRLAELLIERPLGLTWGGYARVHPGMTRDLLSLLRQAGCRYLSYGIESGSPRVLRDMNKQISLTDASANLKDTFASDIETHVNWIVGFPTESWRDFLLSLCFIFRNRRVISNFNPGQAPCGIPLDSYIAKNPGKFNLDNKLFLGQWMTVGYRNTILHRKLRLKVLRFWLDVLGIKHS